MKSPIERDATTLRQALTGPIIDVKAATEIICTRTSSQIRQIKQVYTPTFGTRLEYDIGCHTSDDHKKVRSSLFLSLIVHYKIFIALTSTFPALNVGLENIVLDVCFVLIKFSSTIPSDKVLSLNLLGTSGS